MSGMGGLAYSNWSGNYKKYLIKIQKSSLFIILIKLI
jgi:hypothetical protein